MPGFLTTSVHAAGATALHTYDIGQRVDERPTLFKDPLPPVTHSALDTVALNPQPLPPGDPGLVALNPQPLPPVDGPGHGPALAADVLVTVTQTLAERLGLAHFEEVALNPQPLPPKDGSGRIRADDYCGTVRRVPLPPHPPGPGFGPAGQG